LFAATAAAQTNNPQGIIKHVIVIVQENRTPDNLFGSNPAFETKLNLVNSSTGTVLLTACWDLGHVSTTRRGGRPVSAQP
jgi:phospholipase C